MIIAEIHFQIDYIFSKICHLYVIQTASYPVAKVALSLAVKQLGHEHDQPAQSNAKTENVRSFTFTPSYNSME
jgi:hypothetical protein